MVDQLTATVVPVKGGYVLASKTSTPLVLEVSSYAIAGSVEVDSTGAVPVVGLTLSGEYVDSTDSVPAGQWHVAVAQGSTAVLDTEVAQPAGEPAPVRVPVTGELAAGATYSVSAEFTPVESVAAGLEITQPAPQTFSTPAQTLASEVPYPLWLMILTALVPLGLAAAVIVLTVRLSRRGRLGAPVDAVEAPEQLAPTQVLPQTPTLAHQPGEFTQLITPVVPPAEPAPTPTLQSQPEPAQNWSLSQDEPNEPDSPVLR